MAGTSGRGRVVVLVPMVDQGEMAAPKPGPDRVASAETTKVPDVTTVSAGPGVRDVMMDGGAGARVRAQIVEGGVLMQRVRPVGVA